MFYGNGLYFILIVRNNILVVVSYINRRLEYPCLQMCDGRSFQAADEFFRFAGEHGSAYHFDPPAPVVVYLWLNEHKWTEIKFAICFNFIES
jgi:hypothetical protein